jgi:hypothetical protein
MIDNIKQVTALMQKMNAHLPIPVTATEDFIRGMRAKSFNVSSDSRMEITSVLYMGDEGGICCALTVTGLTETAVVASLTQVRIPNTNPLSIDVKAYQILHKKIVKAPLLTDITHSNTHEMKCGKRQSFRSTASMKSDPGRSSREAGIERITIYTSLSIFQFGLKPRPPG